MDGLDVPLAAGVVLVRSVQVSAQAQGVVVVLHCPVVSDPIKGRERGTESNLAEGVDAFAEAYLEVAYSLSLCHSTNMRTTLALDLRT